MKDLTAFPSDIVFGVFSRVACSLSGAGIGGSPRGQAERSTHSVQMCAALIHPYTVSGAHPADIENNLGAPHDVSSSCVFGFSVLLHFLRRNQSAPALSLSRYVR